MLNFNKKLKILENCLSDVQDNYSDSFKTDISFYLEPFDSLNPKLLFLNNLDSEKEIINWVEKITSKIVMNFNEDEEQLSDFICYEIL